MRTKSLFHALLPALLLTLLAGCASRPAGPALQLADNFDLESYMGEWFVIAHIPYFAERGNLAPRVDYRPRPDGRMDDFYYYRESFEGAQESMTGVAWVVDEAQPARWKARFFWPFTFDYLVLKVDPDYQLAAVGHPSRDYAWIFSRTPEMTRDDYDRYVGEFARQGYDTSRLVTIAQSPDRCPVPDVACSR